MNGDSRASNQQVPEETKSVPEVPKPVELTDDALASVSGGASPIEQMMAALKVMDGILDNVSKTRAQTSEHFARNSRA